jgi:hypothetical protein
MQVETVKRNSNRLRATSEGTLLGQERENGPLRAGCLSETFTLHKIASRTLLRIMVVFGLPRRAVKSGTFPVEAPVLSAKF